MLMRFAKVTEDGQYIPPPPANQKASYATMVGPCPGVEVQFVVATLPPLPSRTRVALCWQVYVRATIINDAGNFLGRAITIATRYCAVRRQTAPSHGDRELQVSA